MEIILQVEKEDVNANIVILRKLHLQTFVHQPYHTAFVRQLTLHGILTSPDVARWDLLGHGQTRGHGTSPQQPELRGAAVLAFLLFFHTDMKGSQEHDGSFAEGLHHNVDACQNLLTVRL